MPTRSILPADLLAALKRIGEKLEQQLSVASDYEGVVRGLNALPPTSLAQAEREIFEAARLYHWAYRRRDASSTFKQWFTPKLSDDTQLRRTPGLEYLFLFHRDGHLREAALREIVGPIPSVFLFVAIAWRLNDWATQVRAAAVDCAARAFTLTSPEVIAEGAMILLQRDNTWRRWDAERLKLDEAFARSDVAEKLADLLATRPTGPSATILRYALRNTSMDPHLSRLAKEAFQPAVRAVAVQALIDGFTSWPNGWRWRWIDKSMGDRRVETVFETRKLTVQPDRLGQIQAGLRDRSAAVRNAAIAGLIRYGDAIPELEQLAEPLLGDPSRRVRERAEFFLRPR